jgi:hypothetical protein
MTVSWFVSQNQAGYGLSVAPQNQRESNNVEHASRSSVLLRVEVSWARVSQSGLKTGGGATVGGARGTIEDVASRSSRRQWVDAIDYVGPCYPCFVIFFILVPRDVIVF